MRTQQASVAEIFEHKEFGQVRVVMIEEMPWFVGKDVAIALGYTNTRKAIADHVDEEDKKDGVTIRDAIGREQKMTIINESGVYSLIIRSNLPKARDFKRWLTSELLPSLRKHGYYAIPGQIDDIDEFSKLEDPFLKMMKLCDRYSVLTEKLEQTAIELDDLQSKKRKLIEKRNSLSRELEELRAEVEVAAVEFLKPVRRKIFALKK